MNGSILTLADLVAPTSPTRFAEEHWLRQPVLFKGALAGRCEEILDLRALELLLFSLPQPQGWLHLARGRRETLPPQVLREDGRLHLPRVFERVGSGESLYLTKAERLHRPLMAATRRLELELAALGILLRQPVSAHVFLTPPHAQGFLPHRDEHSGFILQLEGSKTWKIYETSAERPGERDERRAGGVGRALSGETCHTFELEAGDVLYVPELWIHEARTAAEHSLHVTLRVFATRWIDLLARLVERGDVLRGFLPRTGADALAAALSSRLGGEAVTLEAARIARAFVAEQAVPAGVLPGDALREAIVPRPLDAASWVEHRDDVGATVTVEGNTVAFRHSGGVVRAASVIEPVFRFIAATPRFRPADVPALGRDDVEVDAIEIVDTLIKDGFLRRAAPHCRSTAA